MPIDNLDDQSRQTTSNDLTGKRAEVHAAIGSRTKQASQNATATRRYSTTGSTKCAGENVAQWAKVGGLDGLAATNTTNGTADCLYEKGSKVHVGSPVRTM